MDDAPLSGKVALVTGGGTGLGRAISMKLAQQGLAVAVNYAHSNEEAVSTVALIEEAGGQSLAVEADVADESAVARMNETVTGRLGPVDVLVNNAGVTAYVPFEKIEQVTPDQWEHIMGVNVLGAFLCAKATVPSMRARGFGRIVNVAGNAPFRARGSSIPYTVSKAAVISLTHCLARALAPEIQVNAVAPGWMDTRWIDRNLPAEVAESVRRNDSPVPVEDVARGIEYLVSAGSVTGEVMVIDQGATWL